MRAGWLAWHVLGARHPGAWTCTCGHPNNPAWDWCHQCLDDRHPAPFGHVPDDGVIAPRRVAARAMASETARWAAVSPESARPEMTAVARQLAARWGGAA